MKKFRLLVVAVMMLGMGVVYAQTTEKKTLRTEEYQAEVEVCVDCQVQPQAELTYYFLKEGKVEKSKGKVEGKVLHGKAKLFNEGMEPGAEELIMEGTFLKGLPHGELKHYVFGVLELVEMFDNGKLKKRMYYTPQSEGEGVEIDHTIEYLGYTPEGARVKVTYHTFASRIEGEGIEKEQNGELVHIFDGTYKRSYFYKEQEELKEEGTYRMNKRVGEWKTYYNDGVVGIRHYDDQGLLVSEKFLKNGQPFTGTVIDEIFNHRIRVGEYQVKEGVRNGLSKFGYRKEAYLKQVNYANGVPIDNYNDTHALRAFLKNRSIVKEANLKLQCDQRGGGLFIDKIQYTDKNEAIVYVHFRALSLKPYSSVFTGAPGANDAFAAIDIATQKVFPLKAAFNIELPPSFYPITFGEQISFQLVIDGLTPAHRFISIVEGDPLNSYIVKEDGTAQYLWGCYEVNVK
ncbi:antitoxin component YwqK of YwqJK toxin-antitoxin module [Thermonema lapsum]|uniref:Antitoxin component YwqK of YwqJK toxin-antitoxin module n=1 Tax=Thermonema lapsum TaxID=28195 RepID=A0A846MPH6_9BACT|nr:hypothetical protein [Thermonema lapsum]NIK73434.1 antitoxin component YwqK of YwqJK toxin-antitoxin module [Thermonema lapsum]